VEEILASVGMTKGAGKTFHPTVIPAKAGISMDGKVVSIEMILFRGDAII